MDDGSGRRPGANAAAAPPVPNPDGWNPLFKLRAARSEDPVRRIVEGFREAIPFRAFGDEHDPSALHAVVADAGGAVLGLAVVDAAAARILLLAVPPLSRGFGVTGALVDHAEALARRAGRPALAISIASDDPGTYAALRDRGYAVKTVRCDAWSGEFIGPGGREVRDEWILHRTSP